MGGGRRVLASQTEQLPAGDIGKALQHYRVGVGINHVIHAVIKIQTTLPAFTWHQQRLHLQAQGFAPAVTKERIPREGRAG